MQVPTIEMNTAAAAEMVEMYRTEIRKANESNPRRATAIDRLLLRGYRKLAAGQRLIDIVEVMRALTVYDQQCRPKLAFARATATTCEFHRPYGTEGEGHFLDLPRARGKRALHKFAAGTFRTWQQLGRAQQPQQYRWDHKARVPPVPLYLRPTDSLANYFILFEAEWEPIPPRDPMLLKPISETLFVIVAEWNLTDLERGVLQGLMRDE